jgi:hypothetical protein
MFLAVMTKLSIAVPQRGMAGYFSPWVDDFPAFGRIDCLIFEYFTLHCILTAFQAACGLTTQPSRVLHGKYSMALDVAGQFQEPIPPDPAFRAYPLQVREESQVTCPVFLARNMPEASHVSHQKW